MYENYKLYGPYLNKKDNRLRLVLVNKNTNKKTSISYPKYLMEIHLNRYLKEDETVDHIDGNPLNNELSNLQILKRKEHSYLDANRNKDVIVTCSYCKKEFTIKGSLVHQRNRKDRYQSGYFCSRQCAGKYGVEIQHNKRKLLKIPKIVPQKYKVKSAQKETFEVEAG